jgi:hypothetical protein
MRIDSNALSPPLQLQSKEARKRSTETRKMHYPIQYESMEAVPQSQSTIVRRVFARLGELCRECVWRVSGLRKSALLAASLLLAGGLWLRLWLLGKLFEVNGDAQIYGGIAKNLLLHGRYALNGTGSEVYPTLIRLPGYPFFLAASFRLFGMENDWAVALLQIALELVGCLLLADFARRIAPPRRKTAAALATLALAALCPFTASYTAVPLTEAPTLFAIALALWAAGRFRECRAWASALAFTFAVTFAALLRPDGALLGVALAPALLAGCWSRGEGENPEIHSAGAKSLTGQPHPANAKLVRMASICVLLATLPFALWGWRNWKVFHVFEPLAPRYATDPGEEPHQGWIRWIKTWCLDFNCTEQVYWVVPGDRFDLSALPARAFDSSRQYDETAALAADYNRGGMNLTSSLDARFAHLAEERERAHPLRSHLLLPLGRLADMVLRPRIENLPIDLDWRVYAHHHRETAFSWFYVGLNALFLLLGLGGLLQRPRLWPWMLLYILLRCALLCTIEAPEARYTLEFFPLLFVWGGLFLSWVWEFGLNRLRN